MIVSAIGDSKALQAVQGTPLQPKAAENLTANEGFEKILNGLGANAFEALRTGESTAIAAIEGKATTQQAVMATMEGSRSARLTEWRRP